MDENASSARDDGLARRYREVSDNLSGKFQAKDDVLALDRMKVEVLENRMQEMRQALVDDIDVRLSSMMTEVMQGLQKNNIDKKETYSNRQQQKGGPLLEKQFVARNSYLTDLFKVNHIWTIYNIFVVMLLVLFLNTVVHDYIETGTTHLGVKTIKLAFGNVYDIIQIWTILSLSTFLTYLGFSLWANTHTKFAPKSAALKVFDYGSLIAFIFHQIIFIAVPAKFTIEKKLPPAASLLILMEQVRMLMKTHAFVRSNVPRVLSYKPKEDDGQGLVYPEFSKFLYFMFAPTLLYRDEYPRTKTIRWRVVIWNFTEVVLVVFYVAFIFERFVIPPFEKYGPRIFEPQFVILTIISTMLPALLMYLFGFYCILHSWQNGMAELLRFADRLFYKDWWNCTSYGVFYRDWNIPVHDWLHQYIYKDIYMLTRNKVYATLMTFIVSALFHEYILTFAFGFFYPVLLIMFGGFGIILVFIMKKYSTIGGNIFMWFSVITGNGILYTLYPMEFYARSNCPPYSDKLLDLVLPRSWICHNVLNGTASIS